jgi:hypothetical protein
VNEVVPVSPAGVVDIAPSRVALIDVFESAVCLTELCPQTKDTRVPLSGGGALLTRESWAKRTPFRGPLHKK